MKFLSFMLGLPLIAALSLACGGNGDESWSDDAVAQDSGVEDSGRQVGPVLVNSTSLAVGANRLQFVLIDKDGVPQAGVAGRVRLYQLDGDKATLNSEHELRAVTVHLDGTGLSANGHSGEHAQESSAITAYVLNAELPSEGSWGATLTLSRDNRMLGDVRLKFFVQADTAFPNIGDPVPPSIQRVLSDVQDISEIDSAEPPDPEMHTLTVSDALRNGKPTVVAFNAPAFCTSRLCGPVLDEVVRPLQQQFQDRVQFIHIEPYSLKEAHAEGKLIPVPTVNEWGLQSEPWLFVVGADGRVVASFEGITSLEEVRPILERVAAGG